MRLGVHENYQGSQATTFAKTAATFPLAAVTREFEAGQMVPQDLVKRVVARCMSVWQAGKTAVWSFKPSPTDVKSGAWEGPVRALGQYLHDHGRQAQTVVVIWHEAENKFTPDVFVPMFNQIHDYLIDVDPTIVTSHAALAYAYRDKAMSDETAARWVTKATVHSIDIYSGRSFPLSMTLGTSTGFRRWKASRPAGSKWGVSERGWIATKALSAKRVAAIDAEADWLMALPVAERPDFYVVWNTAGVENDPTIVLDAAGTEAVNRMFQRLDAPTSTPSAGDVCPLCTGTGTVAAGTHLARVGNQTVVVAAAHGMGS